MKKCPKCNQWLPEKNFNIRKRGGVQSYCRKCCQIYWSKYRKKYRRKTKICPECGEKMDYRSLFCKKCSKLGKRNAYWKGGLPKCIDCRKQLAQYDSTRCHSCANMGKLNPGYKHGKKSKLTKNYCINCGKKISLSYSTRCKKCSEVYYVREKQGNWKGGKSFEPYGIKFNKVLKEDIRKQDGYICQKCGAKQNGQLHCVHHIDYNKKNNNKINLITLCRSCNAEANGDREYWTNYFQKYIKGRRK